MSPARRPLASVDAAWLHMDAPTNPMVITVALFFDAPLDVGALRARVAERLRPFERFRRRVGAGPGGAPRWEELPGFAIESHVHRIGLPGAGGDAELRELLADLISTPLDPTRPLWQMYLVERYGEGCVLVLRVHHCLADGVTLVQIFDRLLDGPPGAAPAPPEQAQRARGPLDGALGALGAALRTTERALHEGLALARRPERALGALGGGAAVLAKLALMGPDAPSVFRGRLSGAKRAAWSRPAPLAQAKAIGKVLGGTVNDVLLTAVAGALRRYAEGRGAPVGERGLRALVPVNLLPPGARPSGGNHFGLVYVTLPVAVEDSVERIARLRAEMDTIKRSPEAFIGYGVVGALGALPAELERAALAALSSMASMVITNVPGPREPVSLAGRPVRRAMFWVPEAGGLGLGLSLLSYAGEVQLGVVADAGLVPDPEALAAAFDAELDELDELLAAVE